MLSKKGASPTLGVLSHTCQGALTPQTDIDVTVTEMIDITVLHSYMQVWHTPRWCQE